MALVLLAAIDENRVEILKRFFAERGVSVVSLPSNLERSDLYFEVDGHWNAEGHAFVAGRVLVAIIQFDLANTG